MGWIESGTVERVLAVAGDEVHEMMGHTLVGRGIEDAVLGESYAALLLGPEGQGGVTLHAPGLVTELPGNHVLTPAGPVGEVTDAIPWGSSPTSNALATVLAARDLEGSATLATPGPGSWALVTLEAT